MLPQRLVSFKTSPPYYLYFALLKVEFWRATATYSPQTSSTAIVVAAPAVAICLNSLLLKVIHALVVVISCGLCLLSVFLVARKVSISSNGWCFHWSFRNNRRQSIFVGVGGRKSQKNGLVTGALFFSSPLVSRFAKNAAFDWPPPPLKRNWGERPLCPGAVNCVLFFVFPLTVLKGVLLQHSRSYSQPSDSSAIT